MPSEDEIAEGALLNELLASVMAVVTEAASWLDVQEIAPSLLLALVRMKLALEAIQRRQMGDQSPKPPGV